jgi:DNA-binding XRE family transcriptional regulator
MMTAMTTDNHARAKVKTRTGTGTAPGTGTANGTGTVTGTEVGTVTGTGTGTAAAREPASWAEFGRLLRRLRVSANLTQERLAALSGVTPRSIGSIERGQTAPRASTVDLLVATLARRQVNSEPLRLLALRIRTADPA